MIKLTPKEWKYKWLGIKPLVQGYFVEIKLFYDLTTKRTRLDLPDGKHEYSTPGMGKAQPGDPPYGGLVRRFITDDECSPALWEENTCAGNEFQVLTAQPYFKDRNIELYCTTVTYWQ